MKKICLPFSFIICLFASHLNAQIVTTVAGNGSPVYGGDGGPATAAGLPNTIIAMDVVGNCYTYGGVQNGRVRKIATSGIITTVAGSGSFGYLGDGGPATAASLSRCGGGVAVDASGNIYIADSWNNVIRKVNTSGIINTIAGTGIAGSTGDGGPATIATLDSPENIALDAVGNLYVAEPKSNRIRKVSTTGIITTIAGTGVAGYAGDGGPATAAQISYAQAVTADVFGNIYISDGGNLVIRKINAAGVISTVSGGGTPPPLGSFFWPGDGGPATAAAFFGFGSVAVDGSGNVYIASVYGVRRVNTLGVITTVAGINGTVGYGGDGGAATAANFSEVYSLALDGSGNLYVSDGANDRVRKISGITAGVSQPMHVDGNIAVVPNPNNGVFTIKGPSIEGIDGNVQVVVTDLLGRNIYASEHKIRNGRLNEQIILGDIPGGVYELSIRSGAQSNVSRFVVEK